MQLSWGYAPPLIVAAALDFRVFDLLDQSPKTVGELAAKTGASARGLLAILNALVGLDLLTRRAERYALTPESAAFLVSTKPTYRGGGFQHMVRQALPPWMQLSETVRTGHPAANRSQEETGAEFFAELVGASESSQLIHGIDLARPEHERHDSHMSTWKLHDFPTHWVDPLGSTFESQVLGLGGLVSGRVRVDIGSSTMSCGKSEFLYQGPGPSFVTTHWSTVLAAGAMSSRDADEALERLCRAYWFPLYAFVRRKGYSPHEAEDLTQGFFARFVEKRYLDQMAPEKGKFRTFLLCSLNHFLANEWDKSQRLKRGGDLTFLPLETTHAEERYGIESEAETPERAFDRRWAEAMLQIVLRRLRAEFDESRQPCRFDQLKTFLPGEPDADAYAVVAQRLQVSPQGVKSAVHRLRRRFRDLFREEIAHTVATRAEIDEELRYLVQLMTS